MSQLEASAGVGVLETPAEAAPAAAGKPALLARLRWIMPVLALLVVIAGPRFLSPYGLTLAFTLFTYVTLAEAWNLIGGYGGQFSLGHALFVGSGSYGAAVLLTKAQLPLGLIIVLSGVITAIVAATTALPLLRLRSVYFAVGSLGIALAGESWMVNWDFTGQSQGIGVPASAALDFNALYYLTAGLMVLTMVCVGLMVRGAFGLRLLAVRDDEGAAAELGVNPFTVKLMAFTASAFFAGLAGALVALQKMHIEPFSAFSLDWTVNMINMSVIGGLATLTGPVVGALVIFGIEQALQSYGALSTLITGALLVLMISVAPGGLWRAVRGQGLRKWRKS